MKQTGKKPDNDQPQSSAGLEKQRKKHRIKKIILGVAGAAVLAFIGYQVYMVAMAPMRTEICHAFTVGDTISGQGMVFRDEQIINIDRHDTVVYSISDGSKVAKGSTIASIYRLPEDSQNRLLADSLKKQIETLKSVSIQSGSSTSYLETISKQITSEVESLSGIVAHSMLENFESTRNSLEYNLIAKDLAIGKDVDLQGRIDEITAEVDRLEKSISAAPTAVESPVAGYFVSSLDLFEADCSADKLTTYSADQLIEMAGRAKAGKKETSGIGKVINGYQWSYAAVITAKDAEKLQAGKKVALSFPLTEAQNIPASVTDVVMTGDGRAIAYFSSSYMTEAIANLRGQDVSVTANSYSGIKVTSSAIRAIEGVKGVFVKSGNEIIFRKVNVLYDNGTFAIVEAGSTGTDYLKLYDEVVVEGRNLYDGKPV